MIINAIACYGASVLIIAAAVFLILLFLKKTGRRLYALHIALGALSFTAVLTGMFILMMYAFSESSTAYMSALMPEAAYKISVAVIFFLLVGLIRYFVINAVYFNRYKQDEGMSFMTGYGLAGCIITALYCLFMFIYVSVTACMHGFIQLYEGQILMFEGGSEISVFTPFYSHIFVAIIFGVYALLVVIIAYFMDQHAKLPYKMHSTFLMYVITNTCEILMVCLILFASSKINTLIISIVCIVIAALAALSVRMLYKYKEELPYSKQFD